MPFGRRAPSCENSQKFVETLRFWQDSCKFIRTYPQLSWGVVQSVGHLTVNEDGGGSSPPAPANSVRCWCGGIFLSSEGDCQRTMGRSVFWVGCTPNSPQPSVIHRL